MNITNTNNYALSSNALFKWDALDNVDYFIQGVTLPGISIGYENLMTQGGPLTLSGYKIDSSNTQIKLFVLVDEKLETWLSLYTKLMQYCKGDEIEGNAVINFYDSVHNYKLGIFLKNAKLVSMSGLDYDFSITRDNILRIELALAFDKIEIINTNIK